MKTESAHPPQAPPDRWESGLSRIFEHHPDAVLLLDLGGRILEANPAACQLCHRSREDLSKLRPWQLVNGVSELEMREWLRNLPRGQVETVLLTLCARRGLTTPVEATVRRVDADPVGDQVIVSCRKLAGRSTGARRARSPVRSSPQKEAASVRQLVRHNKALVEAEERLRLAMELGRVGLWIWHSTPETNPGHWSDRLKEIFGLPLDAEVTHEMFLSRVHPDDRAGVDQAVRDALSGKDEGRYELEYRSIRPDRAEPGWVLARGQAFFDAAGHPLRFIGSVLDITRLKRAEEALRQLNSSLEERIEARTTELERANQALRRGKEDLRLVIDTIPGLVWSSLPDGHIEYLNKRWLDYTGLTLDEASGWGWQQAIHPEDLDRLADYWRSILASGTTGEIEARLRRHDGEYRWFLFRGVPLFDEGGHLVKWYGTNTDVEARRTSERLARGQSEALIQTLSALARESNPDHLLLHVLRTIGHRLRAHSIGVWLMNEQTGVVDLVANWEGEGLEFHPEPARTVTVPPAPGSMPHPVWAEFFRTGAWCIAGDLSPGRVRIRALDGVSTAWHDWYDNSVANTMVPGMIQRLIEQGVIATLSVPMFLAGRVSGFLSVRFDRRQEFPCEEIELARALAHQAMLALQLMRLTRESQRLVVLGERNRMARELHDTLAQGMTAVIMQLEAAEDATARQLTEAVDHHLKRARELARSTLREARRTVRAMRPQALKDQDLCQALGTLLRQMTEDSSLQAELVVRGVPRKLPPRHEENILRISQEVLTNALRHAGATRFVTRFIFSPAAVRLHFHDNGLGFDPHESHEGYGLTGMRERVEGLGGALHIRSRPSRGTSIVIRLANPPTS